MVRRTSLEVSKSLAKGAGAGRAGAGRGAPRGVTACWRLALFLASLGIVLGGARPASAQAVLERRTPQYWLGHAALITSSALIGVSSMYQTAAPMQDSFDFYPDRYVIEHYSLAAQRVSDVVVTAEAVAPVVYFAIEGNQHQVIGGLTVYSEAHAINFALNSLAKYAVRRPRPYTHHRDERVRKTHDCLQIEDDCLSFYSGHSSTAFTSAIAGGYLVNETFAPSPRFKMLNWGVLLAGAAATAHLRVRAGKHFYSDVLVGALVGSGIGLMVPLVHGGSYAPSAPEIGAASAGLIVGTILPLFIPTDGLPELLVTPSVSESSAALLNVAGSW